MTSRERDMRRRDREMRRDMRHRNSRGQFTSDREMDGRNPYGSRGGYVVSDRTYRDMMGRGMDYGYSNDDMANYREYDSRHDYNEYPRHEDERSRRDGERNRQYYGAYGNTPFYVRSGEMYPDSIDRGRRDYGEEKMDREELEEWIEDMKEEIEPQYKSLYSKDKVEDVAKQMQIEFDKFTPMELLASTLIIATDYKHSVGQADINRNVAMGKEFLCDKDAGVKYGEKLRAYYESIVLGM